MPPGRPCRAAGRQGRMEEQMRVAVFGVGAVGGYFGGRLAQAGFDVVFIARGETLRALQTQGLRLESPRGKALIHPVRAADGPAGVEPVDVAILGVKAWQVPEAARALRPLLAPGGFALPLQNGVDAPSQLAEELGPDRAVGGLCRIICLTVGPGHVRHLGGEPAVLFGEMDGRPSARTEALRDAFARAGVVAKIPPDIHVALWEKFLFLAPWSGIGALTRAPIGIMLGVPETRGLFEQAMSEIANVARARGVALPPDAVARSLRFLDAAPPDGTASMQRDIIAGRPSELESQSGAVVRLGREAGVPTPVHAFIYGALLPMERRARGEITFGQA
jgi:2-dehydropantoate 2-reductase